MQPRFNTDLVATTIEEFNKALKSVPWREDITIALDEMIAEFLPLQNMRYKERQALKDTVLQVNREEGYELIQDYIDDKIETFVYENISKEDILEDPQGVFQTILDYIYDILEEENLIIITTMSDNRIREEIIDWQYIQDLLEEIKNMPDTIEDKMADVGISNQDFI